MVEYIYTGSYPEANFFADLEIRDLHLFVANKRFMVLGLSSLAAEHFCAVLSTIDRIHWVDFKFMVETIYQECIANPKIKISFLRFAKRAMSSVTRMEGFNGCLSGYP